MSRASRSCWRAEQAGALWDALVAAGAVPCRAGRARHAAARGLLSALRQRPVAEPHRARGRPGLGVRARRARSSSAPRRCAPSASGPASTGWSRSGCRGAASPAREWPIRPAGEVTSGTMSPSLDVGIGMGYVPADLAAEGTEIEIDVRGAAGRRARRRQAPVREGEGHMSDASYPDELCYHEAARLGPGRRRHRHVRHHVVRAGHAGRGRLLQPAGGRGRRHEGRRLRRARVDQGGVGAVAPLSGEVTEVNDALDGSESTVNDDPYGEGWLIKVRMSRSRPSSTR